MVHEYCSYFYIINCILIRPNTKIAAICKSSFFTLKNEICPYFYLMKCINASIMCGLDNGILLLYVFQKLNYKNGFKLFDTCYIVTERKYDPHDTEIKVNVYLLPNNFSVLSHFQVFLRAEMHILIFLAVVLFAPPCASAGEMNIYRFSQG